METPYWLTVDPARFDVFATGYSPDTQSQEYGLLSIFDEGAYIETQDGKFVIVNDPQPWEPEA